MNLCNRCNYRRSAFVFRVHRVDGDLFASKSENGRAKRNGVMFTDFVVLLLINVEFSMSELTIVYACKQQRV